MMVLDAQLGLYSTTHDCLQNTYGHYAGDPSLALMLEQL
jgi:hypothetical protein